MFKIYLFCVLLILSLTLSGCGGQQTAATSQSSSGAEEPNSVSTVGVGSASPKTVEMTTELTEEQNGGVVALIVNDSVRVKLDGNITTGFSWEVENLDANLLAQIGVAEYTSNSNLAGSGGTFALTFKALNVGVTHLHLIYHRPFEKNVPPAQVFDVTVDIQK